MQDVVICFRILAFITNFNETGREQIRTAGNDLLRMSWQYFPFTCRKEDEVTVCELFDQYERKGKAEGEARRLVMDIENAMKFFQVTLEKACEGLGTTVSGYEEAKKLI